MQEELRPLLEEYCRTLRGIRQAKRKAVRDVDRELLQGMEEDVSWAIEYMASGYIPLPPSRYRRRVIPVDPQKLSGYLVSRPVPPLLPAEEVRFRVLRALDVLTEREREAVLLVRGEGCMFAEAAELMKVSRGTVQKLVERATAKLKAKLGKS